MPDRLASTRAWAVAAALAAVVAYAPSVGYPFVHDDEIAVVRNRWIRSLADLPTLVRSTELSAVGIELRQWRPLTSVTFALNHAAAGLSPWSYHATNVLLHALAAVLLLAVAVRLGLPAAAAGVAALAFAVHPIHVEAVANVTGRKDVLSAVLALAAVLLHRRALTRGGASLAWPVLAVASAMLAKESGVVAVGLAALHDLARPRPGGAPVPRARRAGLYAAYAAVTVAYLLAWRAVTAVARSPIAWDDNPLVHEGPAARIATAIAVVGKGLLLQVLPLGQSPDWSYDAIPVATSFADPRVLATLAALAAWLGAGVALRRRAPAVLVGLGWYLGALLPVSNLVFPVGTIFGERLLYLPSAGLALAAGGLVAIAAGRAGEARAIAGGVAIAGALLVATLAYEPAWSSPGALFRVAVEHAPRSSKAHHQLATVYLREGRRLDALREIERAAELSPRNVRARVTRAEILASLDRRGEAARVLQGVLAVAPEDVEAIDALAKLARDDGRLEDAAALWRRAIAADPRDASALSDLSAYHLVRGEPDIALALARRALDADPDQPVAWYNLALAHRARGEEAQARVAFRRFLERAGAEYAAEAEAVRSLLADGAPPGPP